MLAPIILTAVGETLIGREMGNLKDTNAIFNVQHGEIFESCIGVHELCTGFIDCKPVSKSHNALLCRRCGLRIVIPIAVSTFGKLRQWCAENITSQQK